MGKKTKSKARLDKYYHLSKEMGYRSRAAFKLIQLNKKFNFLSGATVLIDLCAAPGGWCQVAAKEMPISSIKIGIDLDPIKPIPGVTTFQCDITTEQCRHLIRKEIKHLKADVVLHDGAPNVGGQWAKDSYNQNELVLYSIKLATEFLKEGGWFISKVFRSVDYNALLYVMKQLFQKVEATKPLASRSQAAEIFVICQGYKNPSYIDPKLLDPKYALKQIDDEDTLKNNTINSLKAMFAKKKSRAGYNTDTLFIVKSFKDYIECSNPFKFLFETNKIKIETDDCKKYLNVVQKMPKDYLLYFDDLQVLGKKEMEELIIWRNKIRTKLNLSRKENNMEKEEKKEEDKKEKDVNEEMDEEIKKYEKQRKKRLEAQKKKQEKIELSNKKAFILQEDQPHDNDVENDDELYEYMQKNDIDIENLEEPKAEEEEEEDEEKDSKEINYSDLTEDDYIDMMNEDIEENKRLYQEEKEIKKRNKEKGEKKKKKGEIELVKNEEEEKDKILDNEEIEEEEENEGDDSALYDEEEEEDDNEENEEDKELPLVEEEIKNDIIINNPLRKAKKIEQGNKDISKNIKNKKADDQSEEEDNNLSYDTDEELNEEKKDINENNNNNNLLNKKTNRPKDESSSDEESDGYNSDEKAEIRAIAKKMLRKKERLKILNSSYNRYAFEDDGKVPKWFLEDESKHNKPQKPITKAEVLAEKEYLKKITVRMPKKVLEAKARKRNRLNKRLQKIRKQAEGIANQDEYTEISKVKQIEKLYKREINKSKEKKKYIISRSWNNNKGKDSRNVRHVDRRMKKDKRAVKAREKRNKKYKRRR
jgi:AdoMet-dependent rRNA methyltransferase SPB1